ncbi:MAG: phage scaffolding protein [Acetatifactor sp.]|nr:phage scaffolding protein [Acetatifactor sp.]
MQKLLETLKEFGVEIPENKQAEVKKALSEHYKNVAEHDKAVKKLEADRDAWKEKAKTAETILKSFEGIDPAKIQGELDTWKKKAEEAEENAKKQIYERDFADALKVELESVKFTSDAAKRDVMAQIKAAELKLKDGKILGLSDLLDQIREKDASAFVDEEQEHLEAGQARFTQPNKPGSTKPGTKVSMAELMRMKNEKLNLTQDGIAGYNTIQALFYN